MVAAVHNIFQATGLLNAWTLFSSDIQLSGSLLHGASRWASDLWIDLGGARNFGPDVELMLSIGSIDAATQRGFSDVEQIQLLLFLCYRRRRSLGKAVHLRSGFGARACLGGFRPFFGYSETWQLVINTTTTIITFLMVFVLQNSQNRDGKALQAKLDELILTSQAANKFVGIEKLEEGELREMSKTLAEKAECVEEKADEKSAAEAASA